MTNEILLNTIISEVRENRAEIRKLHAAVTANKIKISLFIGAVSLIFSSSWALLLK